MDARNPSDEELWEVCKKLLTDWEPLGGGDDGMAGRKHARTAIRAFGTWNCSAKRRTGGSAPTHRPSVRACSPTGNKVAGNTNRWTNVTTDPPAQHAATLCENLKSIGVKRGRPSSKSRSRGRTTRPQKKNLPPPPQSKFVRPHSSLSFVGSFGIVTRTLPARPSMPWRHGQEGTPAGIGISQDATGQGRWDRNRLQFVSRRICGNWRISFGGELTPPSARP